MSPARFGAAAAVVLGQLRDDGARTILSVAGIALGVALGVAVNLVNGAAVHEFAASVQSLSGEADLVIQGDAAGFDEALYPRLAALPEVAEASPAVEVDAKIRGRVDLLPIVGLDALRAARLQSNLLPAATEGAGFFAHDGIWLTPAALAWLGVGVGDSMAVQVGLDAVPLRVAGTVPGYRGRLGVMDVAAAQWRLGRLGRLDRIDLRLRPGVDPEEFARRLPLPPGVAATAPREAGAQAANLSRAYRVNLNVLALVALFTGAFLVFSTQALGVVRRRGQLALLRVLGVTRTELAALLALEGSIVGVLGAVLGVAGGTILAHFALGRFGGDLGGGYFRGAAPELHVDPVILAGFFGLGVAAATIGALVPALQVARSAPAPALKPGGGASPPRAGRLAGGVAALLAGAIFALLPPVHGLPLFGYLAILLLLLSALLTMPALAPRLLALLPEPRSNSAALAVAHLRGNPGETAASLAAILVSFTLMAAMGIMVASFRSSVDGWLHQILPADLYLRAGFGQETAFIDEAAQAQLAKTPGIARIEFQANRTLRIDPRKPEVALIARPVDRADPASSLPLVDSGSPLPGGALPVWVSEPAGDLFGWRPGTRVTLPLDGRAIEFAVAGVWRDYARQTGAVVIERELYRRLTGDSSANGAAVWLAPGTGSAAVIDDVRAAAGPGLDIAVPAQIRATALRVFDRSFAVTYLLEALAVLIGLFGVANSFGARILARRSEFGMLRHVGMERRRIRRMLALEGALVAGVGVGAGLLFGWLISLVLIHVVNRQSFHWSMDLDVPWTFLALLAGLVIGAATLTVAWSGRRALAGDVIRAVREDW